LSIIKGGRIAITNNIEERVLDEREFLSGESKEYDVDMSDFDAYRITLSQLNKDYNTHLEVRQVNNLSDSTARGTNYSEPILKSLGNSKVVYGNVSESVGYGGEVIWTDIVRPLRKKESIRVIHNSSSPASEVNLRVTITLYKNTSDTIKSKGFNILDYRRTETIEPESNFPKLDSDDSLTYYFPVIIDHLEWSTNHRTMPSIYIEVKSGGEWEFLTRVISRDFSGSKGSQSPEDIQTLKTGLWDILEFDVESSDRLFKFSLRNPIVASEGIRVYLHNGSSEESYSGSIVLKGRKL